MKSCRLDEFDHMHSSAIHAFGSVICDSWATAAKNHVRNSFKDIGKGWFNLNESDRKVRAAFCLSFTAVCLDTLFFTIQFDCKDSARVSPGIFLPVPYL
jgi:hypothetical protein